MSASDDEFPRPLIERLRDVYAPIASPPREDLAAIESAWGHAAPRAFRDFVTELGGGTLVGAGGVLELWWTPDQVALAREDHRAFRTTEAARVLFFASDGGGREYFFDVDGWFGHGRHAVLLADRNSDAVEWVAPTFAAAVERIAFGPRLGEGDHVLVGRPPGSERR